MDKVAERILYKINKRCSIIDIVCLKRYLKKYSQKEVFEIVNNCENINVVKYTDLSAEEKIQCYVNISSRFYTEYEGYVERILNPLCHNDPDLVIRCLKYFHSNFRKSKMLLKISDEYKRLIGTNEFNYIDSAIFHRQIVKSIKNKDILKKAYYDGNLSYSGKFAVLLELEDELKIKHIYEFDFDDQIEILLSIKDELLRKKFINKKMYKQYHARILNSIKDEEFVINYFKENQSDKLCLELINLTKDKQLKNKLVSLLNPSVVKDAIKSNDLTNKEKRANSEEIRLLERIDPKITFGVELECCGYKSEDFLLIKKLLSNWNITDDGSVINGIEVVSPILRFNNNCLRELKFICNLLRDGKFYTNSLCGGHIHFGFSYFNSAAEMKTFLQFYCAIEDILLLLCNKQGTIIRDGLVEYAAKFSPVYNEKHDLVIYADNIKRLGKYVKVIKNITKSRYYALNLSNIGKLYKNTIEFRMPNGEINFDELILNIMLFAKLMEKSKCLSNMLGNRHYDKNNLEILKKYQLILNKNISNNEKVILLLEILFDNKEVRSRYIERYNENNKISNNRNILKIVR